MIDSPISIPMQMDKSKADKIVFSGPVNDFKRTSNPTRNTDLWEEACLWFLGQVTFLLQIGHDDLSLSSGPCSPGYDFCCSHLAARMTIKPTLRMAEETDGEKLSPWQLHWATKSTNPQAHPHSGPLDFLLREVIHFHIVEASLNQGFWSQANWYDFWSHFWTQPEREVGSISYVSWRCEYLPAHAP